MQHRGNECDDHDAEQDQIDVVLGKVPDHRNVCQEESGERDSCAPERCADDVVQRVFAVVHVPDTCRDRGERSNDRNEPGENDRAAAEAIEELVRALDIFHAEKTGLFALEDARANLVADQIAKFAAQERGDDDGDHDDPDGNGDDAGEGEKTRKEQQSVTGKEEPDQEAGLSENDCADDNERPKAHAGTDQMLRVQPRYERGVDQNAPSRRIPNV